MIVVLTYVCTHCTHGWTSDWRPSETCPTCGRRGEVRGEYNVVEVRR